MNNDRQQRQVLFATSISYVIVILDTSIVNVALERIATGLAGSVAGLQWVVNAYTLSFASLLLSGGTLADRFGARAVYMAGLASFTVASALCGAAPSLALLIAGRVLQGVGAALLVPASMALINQSWPDWRERAAVFGLWAGFGGVAMAAGPLLGGVLIGLSGWRGIFLVNVPVCLAGLVMAWRVRPRAVPEAPRHVPRTFDLAGQLAGIATLALLNVSIIEAPVYGWHSAALAGCVAATLGAGALFVAIETRRTHPMLPFSLFRQPLFSGSVIASMVSAFTFYGLLFTLSLYLQQQRGYTPLRAGLAFLPLTIVVPVGSLLSKRAVQWLGPRWLVAGAFVLAAVGFLMLTTVGPAAPYLMLALPLPAIGLAASLITPATTAALMGCVDGDRAGVAAAVLNAARQTGAALGVAISGALIATRPSILDAMQAVLLIAATMSAIAGAI
ncbi:DHA2 family methylenomycin A resistance protein-like MFS transporter [Paraburkholderia sp. GAS333]|uniref:MFS transporter n=1 Tax=Paraburkholderia sp. GAS333 TaxID=3156279 RepID=UPI003D1DA7F8